MRFRRRISPGQFRVLVPAPAKHSMSFGERLRCFGRANIWLAQSFWCDYERVSPKVFASGGGGSDGQSAFANDGRFGSAATKRAAGMGDISVNSRWFCFSLKRFTFNIAGVYG